MTDTAVAERPASAGVAQIILDTNIVLDLLVFDDAATPPLRQALQSGQLQWIATMPMRDELERVLAYPQIVKRLQFYGKSAAQVLAARDAQVLAVDVAPKATVTCKDPDDQKFIDLAVAHRCSVLSKDHAVLCMHKRLVALGSSAQVAIKNVAN
jgi:putative PIN family toxin of toxin-antitoxin system